MHDKIDQLRADKEMLFAAVVQLLRIIADYEDWIDKHIFAEGDVKGEE